MKKLLLLLLCCVAHTSLHAQIPGGEVPVREVLVIDYFSHQPDMPMMYAEMLRDQVKRGFLLRGRHEVVDAAQIPGMNISPERLMASHDPRQIEIARITSCYESGARWLVWGDIADCMTHTETVDGKRRHTSSLVLTLCGKDLLTGDILPVESFNLVGVDTDNTASKKKMIEAMLPKMEYYIDRQYKISGSIMHIEQPNAKGKLKDLYINCGSNIGVHPGDLFTVYALREAGTLLLRDKIAKIRVREVQGPTLSFCTISNGGEHILTALDNGQKLMIESEGQALF